MCPVDRKKWFGKVACEIQFPFFKKFFFSLESRERETRVPLLQFEEISLCKSNYMVPSAQVTGIS